MSQRDVVVFTTGKRWFSVDAGAVVEFTDVGEVAPLPFQIPHVPGLVQSRGRVVPVLDVGAFLGCEDMEAVSSGSSPGFRRLIVVEAEGMRVAIGVRRVRGISAVPVDVFSGSEMVGEDPNSRFTEGCFRAGEDTVTHLALGAILLAARFAGPVQ